MAVAWFKNPVIDESVALVSRQGINEHTFGVTRATRYPAYVYSVNRNACLMHRVAAVEIQHYAIVSKDHGGSHLGRLKQPAMIARTVCGMSFSLRGERSRTCAVPLPDAVLCGRCHGQPATFRRDATSTPDKKAARVKLGCKVAGYPSKLRAAQGQSEERTR